MAKIKLEFDAEPFTGQIVTFVAPCSCEEVTDGLVINGNTYAIVDAMGAAITGSAWCAGALISVSLDVTNRRAFFQNATILTHTHTANDVGAIPTSAKGVAGGVASLDSSGKVPSGQLPSMNYIPTSEKGAEGGVAPMYTYGTTEMTAGTTELETGKIYLQYE